MATISFEEAFGTPADKPESFKPAKREKRFTSSFQAPVSENTDLVDPLLSDDHISKFKALQSEFPNTTLTSLVRTPEKNKAVGGKPNSQHLRGTAGDYVVPTDEKPAFKKRAAEMGYVAIDEGDHIHLQLPKGMGSAVTGSRVMATIKDPKVIPFEEAFGPSTQERKAAPIRKEQQEETTLMEDAKKGLVEFLQEQYKPRESKGLVDTALSLQPEFIRTPVTRAITDGFDGLWNMLTRETTVEKLSPEETAKAIGAFQKKEVKVGDETYELFKNHPFFRTTQPMASVEETRAFEAREAADAAEEERFAESIKDKPAWQRAFLFTGNPIENFLQGNIVADLLKGEAREPIRERQRVEKIRERLQNEDIIENPSKYPRSAVIAAQQAIDVEDAEKDKGVAEAWSQLKKAAVEDPARMVGVLGKALTEDPEMLFLPQGLGLKTARTGQKATTFAQRATGVAANIAKVGTAEAALNLGIEAAQARAEGRELTPGELAVSGGAGFVLGGLLGGLQRGTKARSILKNDPSKLEQILNDAAAETTALDGLEKGIKDFDFRSENTKNAIERVTGVRFESEIDLQQYIKTTRDEWRKLFASRDLNGQFQKALAEERVQRIASLWESQKQQVRDPLNQQRADEVRSLRTAEVAAERAQRLSREYDAALAARDAADAADVEGAARLEDDLRNITTQVDEDEIINSAYESTNAVKRAMNNAVRRDSQLARPKWQRGDVNPKLLTRLGIGSLFAGTAFALAPEDQKAQTAFAAGLAGLVVPGGGRVINKMRQSGAIAADGDTIINLLAKKGKLVIGKSAEEQKVRDAELIAGTLRGEKAAFEGLYKEYKPRLDKFARRLLFSAGRPSAEADDLVQQAFFKAYRHLDRFDHTFELTTWLHKIVENEFKQTIRKDITLKRGKYETVSSELDVLDDEGGTRDFFDEGAGADMMDSPETKANYQETKALLEDTIQKLPAAQRQAFIMNKIEGKTLDEIAEELKMPLGTVRSNMVRASDAVKERIAKYMNAENVNLPGRGSARTALPEASVGEVVKRGRGRPRKQAGEIDPRLMKYAAITATGAFLGSLLPNTKDAEGEPIEGSGKSRVVGALAGGVLAATLLGTRGKALGDKSLGTIIDDTLGSSSTRILNKSPKVFGAIQSTIRKTMTGTHERIQQVKPFTDQIKILPKETQDIIARALYTGKGKVISNILDAIGDPNLSASYKEVRAVLDSLGDQLVGLKRFSRGAFEYFPRIIKDREGLLKAVGKETEADIAAYLKKANTESIQKNGRVLTELEENAIINGYLFGDHKAIQPGWTKARGIQEITPELLPYYATLGESLDTYIRSATADIEKAKFFGKSARNMKVGKHEFLDTDASVQQLMKDELLNGTLSTKDAEEVSELLKSYFGQGSRGEWAGIKNVKNIMNIGLLSNVVSAAGQLSDVVLQTYVQDIRSTLMSVARQVTGRKLVDMKDFGLVDNISEEFSGTLRSTKWLNQFFKYSLFAGADRLGKNTALNAAVIRAQRLAQTPEGQLRLANKYAHVLGDKFPNLVNELKSGKISELTKDYAWMELSRTQPISMLEMPKVYMDHPNARSYLWLKSFTMKQVDLLRRDAYNEIKKGNRAVGLKNLASAAITMGLAGATVEQVKDWLAGKEVKFEGKDVYLNFFKNLGWSSYQLDQLTGVSPERAEARREAGEKGARAQAASPVAAVSSLVLPPYEMWDKLLSGDKKAAYRYLIPIVGPRVAQWMADVNEMEEDTEE